MVGPQWSLPKIFKMPKLNKLNNMKCLKRDLRSGAFLGFALLVVSVAPWARPAPKDLNLVVEKELKFIRAGRDQKPFDVTRHLIPLAGIMGGGPPRDGIPALTDPAFVSAAEADEKLKPNDIVLGLEFGGVAKAYPVGILTWHEVVNDTVGDKPVMVSW